MTMHEAAVQQLKALKGKPLKAKLQHIFTYYWMQIVALIAVVAIVVSGIHYYLTKKSTVLYVSVYDAIVSQEKINQFTANFAQSAGIDQQKQQIVISHDQQSLDGETSAYEGEVLAAQIMGQIIDILVFNEEAVSQWLYQDLFADLSGLLTKEQLEQYEGSLLYVDAAVLQKMEEMNDAADTVSFPDPTKPEEMERPIPVAIRLHADSEFAGLFSSGQGNMVMGIIANAPHVGNAVAFMEYVMG